MKNRKNIFIVIVFAIMMIGIAIITSLIEIKMSKENLLLSVVLERTKYYKIKQIITILFIFLYGKLFLCCIQTSLTKQLQNLLAFPVAICIWCITSYFVLLFGVPYNIYIMGFIIILILGLLLIKNRNNLCESLVWNIFFPCIYAIGFGCLATSGLLYIHLTEDSYYFVSQYAEIITNMQKWDADFCANLMSWTGISPALINSLAIMVGFETIYGIHYMLMFSFVGVFYYAIFEIVSTYLCKKKAQFIAIGTAIFLIITPAVGITMGLELSSSYFMVYIFLLIFLAEKMQYIENKFDYAIVIVLIVMMLVLTRQEASVVLCFFIVGMSVLKYSNKELCCIFILPCFFTQVSYILKMIFTLDIGNDNRILLNVESVIMIMGVNILTLLYGVLVRNKMFIYIQIHLHIILIIAMGVVQIVLLRIIPEKFLINLTSELYNAGNKDWGFSFWIVLLLLLYSVFLNKKLNYLETLWIGYLMYYFILCAGRSYDLRMGITDSYARMMVSAIPIAYYAFVIKLKDFWKIKIKI